MPKTAKSKRKIPFEQYVRKTTHTIFVISLVIVYLADILPVWLYALGLVAGLILSLAVKYLSSRTFLHKLLKQYDKEDFLPAQGVAMFYLGFVLNILIAEYLGLGAEYVVIPVLVLAFADPIGYYIGTLYGKHKLPFHSSKTIEGTLASILMATIIVFAFFDIRTALMVGIISMAVDLLDLKIWRIELDDNLTIQLSTLIILLLV